MKSRCKEMSSSAEGGGILSENAELLLIGQNWRIKKVGRAIYGDLSYRAGKCQVFTFLMKSWNQQG